MKLYHGSPNKMGVLKPQRAKGLSKFENLQAVFLTKTFFHAALYAIGKSFNLLKNKPLYAVTSKNLIIIGDSTPNNGYVYEVEVENPIKGKDWQYASLKELIPVKITKVYYSDYKKYIIHVKTKAELYRFLNDFENSK